MDSLRGVQEKARKKAAEALARKRGGWWGSFGHSLKESFQTAAAGAPARPTALLIAISAPEIEVVDCVRNLMSLGVGSLHAEPVFSQHHFQSWQTILNVAGA